MFVKPKYIENSKEERGQEASNFSQIFEEICKSDLEFTVRVLEELTVIQVFGPNEILEFKFKPMYSSNTREC